MKVNGEDFNFGSLKEKTISALIDYHDLNQNHIAIEINGEVIQKSSYSSIVLKETDAIEIIHFVGGGSA